MEVNNERVCSFSVVMTSLPSLKIVGIPFTRYRRLLDNGRTFKDAVEDVTIFPRAL